VRALAHGCRHFTGIQHETCAAGVRYVDVRDASQPGPYRWPCIDVRGPASTECPKRSLLTAEEHEAREREVDAIVDQALAAIAAGKCHECGAAIEPSRKIGRCLYGACGHRIGQVG
jgi:hypothetical protein